MNSIAQAAAPLAPPAENGQGSVPGGPAAWRRELERAAAGGWFHGPLPAHAQGNGAPPQDQQAPWAASSASSKPLPGSGLPALGPLLSGKHGSIQHSAFNAVLGADMHPLPQPLASLQPSKAGESGWSAPALPLRHANSDPGRAPTAADRRRPAGSLSGPVPASSIRVHVEHSDQGVRVWLGIAADPALISTRLKSIVFELRRNLHGAGQRLAAVVCNGEAIYSDDAAPPALASVSSKESP